MVDFLAVIVLFLTIYAMDRIKDTYGKWLKRALVAGSFAVVANIFVAVSGCYQNCFCRFGQFCYGSVGVLCLFFSH